MTAWFERHNRYSDWEAWLEHHPQVKEQVRQVKSRQGGQLFHKAPFKPVVSFAYMYLYKRGLPGRPGGLRLRAGDELLPLADRAQVP